MIRMSLRLIKPVVLCDQKSLIFKNFYHINKNGAIIFNKCNTSIRFLPKRNQSTNLKEPFKPETNQTNTRTIKSNTRKLMTVFVSGVAAYLAINFYLENYSSNKKQKNQINYASQNLPGKVKPSKSIVRNKNPGNIRITLYQYVTCPFCCKVRAYLDYFGYSYDIVEVNSVYKNQLDWSAYKKVPIVAVQLPLVDCEYDPNIVQLNDSSVIISALETFRLDPNASLKQILSFYEPLKIENNNFQEQKSPEYINKYFIMLYDEKMNDGKNVNDRKLERDWRKWVDSNFIHVISPNVYRTFSEALDAFEWFDKAGDWANLFNTFERYSVYYLGSVIMYLLSTKLKKKHGLKDDVRESLYDLCNEWTKSLSTKTFQGGFSPDLSDLALYGAIGSFKGCTAFEDMMKNTDIKSWYYACEDQIENSKGSFKLNKVLVEKTSGQDIKPIKKAKRFFFF